ncbi:hypothetical protein CC80DRAFT_573691 [Byssothecium circinans]|uniref:Uncharacterized protein n=1 Tax=Byssothecium circinans TaxID=147558 RepID=A0A6A5TFS1_9PLEO|nr:hypothetical protein CC80DRAFT_573691 [Byssothecium circinans]
MSFSMTTLTAIILPIFIGVTVAAIAILISDLQSSFSVETTSSLADGQARERSRLVRQEESWRRAEPVYPRMFGGMEAASRRGNASFRRIATSEESDEALTPYASFTQRRSEINGRRIREREGEGDEGPDPVYSSPFGGRSTSSSRSATHEQNPSNILASPPDPPRRSATRDPLAAVQGVIALTARDIVNIRDDLYAALYHRHPDMPHEQAGSYVRRLTEALTSATGPSSLESTVPDFVRQAVPIAAPHSETNHREPTANGHGNGRNTPVANTSSASPDTASGATLRRRRLSNPSNLHEAYTNGVNGSSERIPTPVHLREEQTTEETVSNSRPEIASNNGGDEGAVGNPEDGHETTAALAEWSRALVESEENRSPDA